VSGKIAFPEMRRVSSDSGSYVDPPLNQRWDDLTKLRWHASVVRVDNGSEIDIDVSVAAYSVGRIRQRGYYTINTRGSAHGPCTYHAAWSYISGIDCGLRTAQDAEVSR
jgi:ABC-type Fe3+ transport system substrate-binding protein